MNDMKGKRGARAVTWKTTEHTLMFAANGISAAQRNLLPSSIHLRGSKLLLTEATNTESVSESPRAEDAPSGRSCCLHLPRCELALSRVGEVGARAGSPFACISPDKTPRCAEGWRDEA